MTIRAKFTVKEITRAQGVRARKDADGKAITPFGRVEFEKCEARTIVLQPVHCIDEPSGESVSLWQDNAPRGKIELLCVDLAAAEHFELGQELWIDFTPLETNR